MNRLIDGGFENWTAANNATYWSESLAGTSILERSTTRKTGSFSAKLYAEDDSSVASVAQALYLVPNRKYRLSVCYKTTAGQTGSLVIRDSTSALYLDSNSIWHVTLQIITLPSSTAWRTFTISFTAYGEFPYYRYYNVIIGKPAYAAFGTIFIDSVSLNSVDSCGFMLTNLWDSGTLTATTAETYFPASYTRHRWPGKAWRSTVCDSEQSLYLDKAAETAADAFIIRKDNLTENTAVLKFQADANNSWGSPEVNETAGSWTQNLASVFWPQPQSKRYWRINMNDTTNADGYVSAGRVFLARVWTPERNILMGSGNPVAVDPSILSEADGGQLSSVQRAHYRTIGCEFRGLSQLDYETFTAHFATAGVCKDFFFCRDLGDPWNELYHVRYAAPPQWSRRYQDYWDCSMQLVELR